MLPEMRPAASASSLLVYKMELIESSISTKGEDLVVSHFGAI